METVMDVHDDIRYTYKIFDAWYLYLYALPLMISFIVFLFTPKYIFTNSSKS